MKSLRRLLLVLPLLAFAAGAWTACGDSGGKDDPEAGLPPLDPNAPVPPQPFCRSAGALCQSTSQCCDAFVCASAGGNIKVCQ